MCAQEQAKAAATLDPARWVDNHGQLLYHYALVRVGQVEVAEDLVQETFLTALRVRAKFAGRSTERTWLTGILRHKILEYFRATGKKRGAEQTLEARAQPYFTEAHHWRTMPMNWKTDPETLLENHEFWHVFRQCVSRLSTALASTFVLHEMDKLASDAICRKLNISESGLWVRLHRARLQLRECLEHNWFLEQT